MKKKGLAVIYDPHNLYQFVWYYCNKGKRKEWDALCLPNGYKGEYMHPFCEKSGIFKKVYRNNIDFSTSSFLQRIEIFIGMFFYFVMGKREAYCKKLLNEYVDLNDYDELVVIADVGIVSGACVALGKEKEVIILEDGINDYGERPRFISRKNVLSFYSWQGLILSLMGYCSPGWFALRTNQHCIKYCSQPDKMKYMEYKEVRQLYTKQDTDIELMNAIIKKIYPELMNLDLQNIEAILFTRPLDDYVVDSDRYKKRFEEYISKKYSSVLVKKHPREQEHYDFGNNVKVMTVDNSIPAEILLPYLEGIDIIIMTTSAIMLYIKAHGLSCTNVIFDGMYQENINSNSRYKVLSLVEAQEFGEMYCEGCYKIEQM